MNRIKYTDKKGNKLVAYCSRSQLTDHSGMSPAKLKDWILRNGGTLTGIHHLRGFGKLIRKVCKQHGIV